MKNPKLILMENIKDVLYNLITDRPANVIDYFEEYVRYVLTKDDKIPEYVNIFSHYLKAETLHDHVVNWITSKDEPAPIMEGEGAELKREYVFQSKMEYFEDCGIALTKIEVFGVSCAILTLKELLKNENIKFWGKIYGLYKNYYIIEVDVNKEMLQEAVLEEKERKAAMAEEEEERIAEEVEEEYNPDIKWHKIFKLADYIKPPIPKSKYTPPKFAPKEKFGTGTNRKVYYVSNMPADGYIKLPDVTPIQIVRARQIKRFFTGVLDEQVDTAPPFPGNESNLLRAQIARISAGTQVSPLGFYSFDTTEGGMDEEEGGGEMDFSLSKPGYTINPDFEPIPLQDLVDPSMAFWVHHTNHILPQGRIKWIDPTIDPNKPKPEGESFDDEEHPEPEVGPPILTAVSDDMSLESIPPWTTRLTMDLAPSFGVGAVRSNLWLGAFAYSQHNDIDFDNIYIGWGMKHNAHSFTPVPYFIPQDEYEIGPEVLEITDPTPEEEDYEEILYQMALAEKRLKEKAEGEEE
ncbi:hypothetical protein O3M35_003366 [Rhynocoris fuscipes]|uniref:Uncharacterized protein n=1 Tax=Rhynocoris fuscipes TaxID=488301 RepID=A0AAW1CMQ6_9HEMI